MLVACDMAALHIVVQAPAASSARMPVRYCCSCTQVRYIGSHFELTSCCTPALVQVGYFGYIIK